MSSRIVYTAGVFDLLHKGHLNILQRSRDIGTKLVVGVVSDEGTRAYKGKYPVQDEETRLAVVRNLVMVDEAVLQPTTDPTPVLEKIRPHVMTHGDDWEELGEGKEALAHMGIEWVLLPYTKGVSTTQLRKGM